MKRSTKEKVEIRKNQQMKRSTKRMPILKCIARKRSTKCNVNIISKEKKVKTIELFGFEQFLGYVSISPYILFSSYVIFYFEPHAI